MTKVELTSVCGANFYTREDGARLRARIERELASDESVEVDLEGKRIASLSFLDEALVSLLLDYAPEDLRERVRVVNMPPIVRQTLNRLAHTRAKTLRSDEMVF